MIIRLSFHFLFTIYRISKFVMSVFVKWFDAFYYFVFLKCVRINGVHVEQRLNIYGFTHAAFTFGFESGLSKSLIDGNLVPPGSLVKFVQKGLQFVEMEANVTNAEIEEDEDFTYLQPLDLITKDAIELHKIVENKRNRQQEAKEKKLNEATIGTTGRVDDNEGKDKTKKASVL